MWFAPWDLPSYPSNFILIIQYTFMFLLSFLFPYPLSRQLALPLFTTICPPPSSNLLHSHIPMPQAPPLLIPSSHSLMPPRLQPTAPNYITPCNCCQHEHHPQAMAPNPWNNISLHHSPEKPYVSSGPCSIFSVRQHPPFWYIVWSHSLSSHPPSFYLSPHPTSSPLIHLTLHLLLHVPLALNPPPLLISATTFSLPCYCLFFHLLIAPNITVSILPQHYQPHAPLLHIFLLFL